MRMIWKPEKRMFTNWPGYPAAIGLVALFTLIKYFAQPDIIPADRMVVYMLAIIPAAIFYGLGSAILAMVLSLLAYSFLFVQPGQIFNSIGFEQLDTWVVFLLVSLVVSYLASGLRQKNEETRELTSRLIKAREDESKRLAMELHDDTAQTLAYLGLEVEAMSTRTPVLPPEIAQRLTAVKEKIDKTQHDIRRFSHELHPAILDNLGLEAALETLTAEINPGGQMEVQFNVDGPERTMPDGVELALYRIAQEALNNVLKHARASAVTVNLRYAANKVKLSIADNGIGFDSHARINRKKRHSLGLINMKERADLIGAGLLIESGRGQGTTVSVEAHLPKLSPDT